MSDGKVIRVTFTLSPEADAVLDALAARDAGDRKANRSATLERLIREEQKRAERRGRGRGEGGEE